MTPWQPRLKSDVPVEPITVADTRNLNLYPKRYPQLWETYEQQLKQHWTQHSIDFSQDLASWNTLQSGEQFFFKNTLANFANSDQILVINAGSTLIQEINIPIVQLNLVQQAAMEGIHGVTYNDAIDTVIKDPKERELIFDAARTSPIVKPKTSWCEQWLNPELALADRLLAWQMVEGLFFASSFASLFWARKRKILPGITQSNEYISKDEALHVELGSQIYDLCINKLEQEDAYALVETAVEIECKFARDGLPVNLLGMNAEMMEEHIQNQADCILLLNKYEPLYNVPESPFEFMKGFGIPSKTNFFEKRSTDYEHVDVSSGSSAVITDFDNLD